jgi:hydroxymethylpyrimidine/phosphomethylpyrimidine kinase|uniref:Uncharacterized protein n=1 Tax=Caulobacter sp. (strain K31) TaxID=366602 RepID=B0TA00_CAUSK
MTTQRNKVYAVTVITAVAQQLGLGEDSIKAFTDEGVEELQALLEAYRQDPNLFR